MCKILYFYLVNSTDKCSTDTEFILNEVRGVIAVAPPKIHNIHIIFDTIFWILIGTSKLLGLL